MARTDAEYAEIYIQLRDKRKYIHEQYLEAVAPIDDAIDKLDSLFLNKLNASGGDSLAFPAATVYKTTKSSAVVKDAEAFKAYVIEADAFDLLDIRANVTAVNDHIEKYSEPPIGVKFTQVERIGVRRK